MTSEDNVGTAEMPHVVLSYEYDDMDNVTRTSPTTWAPRSRASTTRRNRLSTQLWDGPEIDPARVDFFYTSTGRESRMERYSESDARRSGRFDRLPLRHGQSHPSKSVIGGPTTRSSLNTTTNTTSPACFLAKTAQAIPTPMPTGRPITPTTAPANCSDAVYTGADVIPEQVDEYYRYDANGNRTDSYLHGSGYVTGTANQLQESDGTYNYAYDLEGNMIKQDRNRHR